MDRRRIAGAVAAGVLLTEVDEVETTFTIPIGGTQ